MQVAAHSKAWVCGRSLPGTARTNPAGGRNVCLLWILLVVQVEMSAMGRSLVERRPAVCVCVCVCVCMCVCVWSGAVVTLYTNTEYVDQIKEECKLQNLVKKCAAFYSSTVFLLALTNVVISPCVLRTVNEKVNRRTVHEHPDGE